MLKQTLMVEIVCFHNKVLLHPSYLSITQGSAQELLPKQNDTEPSDALTTQDKHHDNH